jgi:hypothetical protein
MSHVFSPMRRSEKEAFVRAYLEHLARHDGEIDRAQRRFRIREAFFARVEHAIPLREGPPVVQATFDRNNRPGPIDPGLDAPTLWALTAAKANLSERWAIDRQLAMSADAPLDRDDPQSYIDIEEHYHTRILSHVLAAIGLKPSFGPPPLPMRLLIAVMIRLPRAIANTVILAAELGGVILFSLLLDEARKLFAHEPAALVRIEQLFAQIIGDEIGHVLYVRTQLGPVRLWLARHVLLPVVAALYRHEVPEIDRLFGARALLAGMKRADLHELRRLHPDPMRAEAMFTAAGLGSVPMEA